MNIIQPPELDINKVLYSTHPMPPHVRREQRIVANLIHHLEQAGFKVMSVYDSEEDNCVSNMKEAMELIFNLDDAVLWVMRDGFKQHYIQLVMGNDLDIISDYSFTEHDPDGFQVAMEAFDTEELA